MKQCLHLNIKFRSFANMYSYISILQSKYETFSIFQKILPWPLCTFFFPMIKLLLHTMSDLLKFTLDSFYMFHSLKKLHWMVCTILTLASFDHCNVAGIFPFCYWAFIPLWNYPVILFYMDTPLFVAQFIHELDKTLHGFCPVWAFLQIKVPMHMNVKAHLWMHSLISFG